MSKGSQDPSEWTRKTAKPNNSDRPLPAPGMRKPKSPNPSPSEGLKKLAKELPNEADVLADMSGIDDIHKGHSQDLPEQELDLIIELLWMRCLDAKAMGNEAQFVDNREAYDKAYLKYRTNAFKASKDQLKTLIAKERQNTLDEVLAALPEARIVSSNNEIDQLNIANAWFNRALSDVKEVIEELRGES